MKRLIILLSVLFVGLFVNAQIINPVGTGYPLKQNLGSDSAFVISKGAVGGKFVIYAYTDTTAANLTRIKDYPFAVIATTANNSLWTRNQYATQWMLGSGSVDIDNFEFLNDSTLIICYESGACDTISMTNFNTVVNNLIQNFIDSSVFNLNDSTIIICNAAGSCDTISLGTTNNFYFLNDSVLVTCDTLETICVGDSCYQQQICDTIPIPLLRSTVYQNGVQKLPNSNIVQHGKSSNGEGAGQLIEDTWLFTRGNQYTIQGTPIARPPFMVQQSQWVTESPSIIGFNHYGDYPNTGIIDSANRVNLYLNYTNPFDEDTTGFMHDRIGYMWITNAQGGRYAFSINNTSSKQAGIMFHTLDTAYNDGVTIFAQEVPSTYNFANNPPVDSTLLSKRVAVFKTNQQLQLPEYIDDNFTDVTPTYGLGVDSEGNVVAFPPGGGGIVGGANNGLSVSSTNAQLGQSVGAVGNPAILLSHREIPMGGFYLTLNASASQAGNIFQTKNASAAVRARVTDDASFSNTGGQTSSEIYGDNAYVKGINALAVGNAAQAGEESVVIGRFANDTLSTGNVLVGKSALVSGVNPGNILIGSSTASTGSSGSNIIIGTAASSSGTGGVGVGHAVTLSNVNNIVIGNQAIVGHTYSQVYGAFGTSTAANQFVVGGTLAGGSIGTYHYYFGGGVANISGGVVEDIDFNPTGAFGTDQAGVDFYINGAKRTGNSTTGGDIRFQTSDAGASGTTLQSLTTKAMLSNSIFAIGITSGFNSTRLEVVDNALGNANMVRFASSSTAAASNGQKLVAATLSGTNATASQTTYTGWFNNSHDGTGAANFAVRGQASGGASNVGVQGESSGNSITDNYGVQGIGSGNSSTNNYGVYGSASGTSTNNYGGYFGATNGTNNYALVVPASSGRVVFGAITSDANALLELVSTSQAFILMRMTAAQASAITAADGMLLYVTDTDATFTSVGVWAREAGAWVKL